MRVLVVGSGAIGGYFGGLMARGGHDVTMLARGAHLDALRRRGIELREGPDAGVYPVRPVAALADAPEPDLVIFAVKTYDTAELCAQLAPSLPKSATVLELQNGIDRADIMNAMLGDGSVLPGAVYGEIELAAPGVVRYLNGARRIVFGEPDGPVSERARRLCDALLAAGIDARADDDMRTELWHKFVLVCAANALTALARQPFGEFVATTQGRRVVADLLGEGVAVGRVAGARFADDAVEASVSFLESMGPHLRSSMLRDLQHGRRTEIDALSGRLVEEGERLGVDTPLSRLVWVAVGLQHGKGGSQ